MKKHKLSIIGLFLSAILYLFVIILDIQLFEKIVEILYSLERYEIDEFIVPVAIFGIFVFIEVVRRMRSQEIEFEKIMIYKAMMSSTHHILNNFLHQMQLFKLTAENTPGFPPKVLSLYDNIIEDASTQIERLGSISNVDEASILASVAPQSNTQSSTQQIT